MTSSATAPVPALHRETVGEGPNRVVMLHGFAHTARSWLGIASDLVRMRPDLTCTLVDLPGHGSTEIRPSFTELTGLIARLSDGAVVIGYSMGARLGIAAACTAGSHVRGLVTIGGTAGIRLESERESRARDDAQLADRIETIGTTAFLDEWLGRAMFAGYTPDSETLRERRRNEPSGLAYALRELGPGSQPSYWDVLTLLRMPVLTVAGAHDTKFATLADDMCALIPGCQRRLIADAGHVAHLERPSTAVRLVAEFLDRADVFGPIN